MKEKIELTPELAYLFGVIGGDGTFSEYEQRISVTDECMEFHEKVLRPLLERLFKKRTVIGKIKTRKKIAFRTRIVSREAIELFKQLGMPVKEKTYKITTPQMVFDSSKEVIKAYIQGWMDAEGWVTVKRIKRGDKSYEYPKIAFQVVSEKIRDDIVKLLEKFDIKPSLWKYKQMHGMQIIGFDKVKQYSEQIGFLHPKKLLRVQEVCRFEAKRGLQCMPQ